MMEDVELVIKMPEEVYKSIINSKNYISYREYVEEAIKNGTPLPKGHGDLIDKSKIKAVELEDSLHSMHWEQGSEIDLKIEADAIIEADKEDKE